jgi:hypothetical protein
MTDEQLDRMVRDADPYRPELLGPLDDEQAALLTEITTQPALKLVVKRRSVFRHAAAAVATAAVLAGVFVVTVVVHDRSGDDRAGPAVSNGWPTTDPAVLKAAEESPRLLIDQPGWTVTSVYGFAGPDGSLSYSNAGRQIELTWYAADQYQSYYKDRLEVSPPQPVLVDRWPANVFRYTDSDFEAMLTPRDGTFVGMRTSGTWTRAQFDELLTRVKRVNVRTWQAALPLSVVTPPKAEKAAGKILADVPLPPGFDVTTLNDLGTNDAYQFGADVTGRVGCGWIAEWKRANQAGDQPAKVRAATALRSSHHWQVLSQMQSEGDYPMIFWETADLVAAGRPPTHDAEGLGCP